LGFIPEGVLADHYAAADCSVMPSVDLEGFGLSTVESLACGTPVIGTRRGATPEILEPLSANLLYDAPTDLPAKLRAVLKEPSLLPSSQECREYAEARYSWAGPVTAMERICKEVAA
jgi:glycosyltransferase involved in cell wall biosynthesis